MFISRKLSDDNFFFQPEHPIREQLEILAGGRLKIIDAGNIQGGDQWLEQILKELKSANLLIVIMTRPEDSDFGWQLFEAGFFRGLDHEDRKRVICWYPENDALPDPLQHIQGIEATPEKVSEHLLNLFTNEEITNTLTPLNKVVTRETFQEVKHETLGGKSIAEAICNEINGKSASVSETITIVSPHLDLVIDPEKQRLDDDTNIEGDKTILFRLFGTPPSGDFYTWGDIKKSCDLGSDIDPEHFNTRWTKQVEGRVPELLRVQTVRHNVTARMLGQDGEVYLPQVEIYRERAPRTKRVTLLFSLRPQDKWLKIANPQLALAANINLANRIRHHLLIPYYNKNLDQFKTPDYALLDEMVGDVELEGFFIKQLTGDALDRAFRVEHFEELNDMHTKYKKHIRPKFDHALKSENAKELREALGEWIENNAVFLNLGLEITRSTLDSDHIL